MLNAPTRLSSGSPVGIRPEAVRDRTPLSLRILLTIVRRQLATMAIPTIVAVSVAAFYLLLTPARYAAVAELLTDTKRSHSVPDAPGVSVDSAVVESQIETIKSEKIALAVITKLGLDKDPEFTEPDFVSRVLGFVGIGRAPMGNVQDLRQRKAIDHFEHALQVYQVGRSYVAVIRFISLDPEKAARVANAICEAYIEDQLEARTSNATRAAFWFEHRLDELRKQASDANRALEAFRAEHVGTLDSSHQAQLQTLLAAAEAYKRSYETFQNLSRYSQTVEEQSFPATEARVVTQAQPPLTRSSPKVGITLLLSTMAGLAAGLVLGFTREQLNRTVRSREELERELHVKCLGFLPLLGSRELSAGWRKLRSRTRFGFANPAVRAKMIPLFNPDGSLSGTGETLIGLRVAIDDSNRGSSSATTVGITSAHFREGKTTVALNLAKCIADGGKRVLLVDADLRNPSLTMVLVPDSKKGIADALSGRLALSDLPVAAELGFSLLPEPLGQVPPRPPDVLSSPEMRDLLSVAKLSYDYIILDLPPTLDHVDVRASAHLLDAFVLVAEWGRTRIDDLQEVCMSSNHVAERLVGVVVNKAHPSVTPE